MLTNYHVVQGAGSISVTVAQTGQTYQATVVGIDPAEDVALIQLTGASGLTTIKPYTDAVNIGAQLPCASIRAAPTQPRDASKLRPHRAS